ncbi:LOW QUALITY PROTEIN: hepatic triacylglycerol lipase [Syngnathoides biaculeatus]|uniref:LOW QUALITY PROTEIN: hepatic triacylglycerol lipase n=1 Tax=Syngnathoides biaculeatus TaxID=300417 RepID=UPI002ADE0AF0|nr:LOW QUALITY PROTEIN: hepatic triacylglycerol lipase [Syngnathoides biaculeatus]
MSALKVLCCLLLACHAADGKKTAGNQAEAALPGAGRGPPKAKELHVGSTLFRLLAATGEDTCALEPSQLHGLSSCGFNASNPLIIISHGWSVNGIMESWVMRLATILKTHLRDVNVVMTDWLSLAQQYYPKAAYNTRTVGKDIAHLLLSLKEHYNYSFRKVHLIGYSLGAHVSGFAGSYLKGPERIGRITGLDPAGPLFEGMSPADRLSPDDADFVDAIHTFTHERLGLSVGIKQPVAHYDFYPNGGDFQPGCDLARIYEHISQNGVLDFVQTVKCAHERSVHLFIDSVVNKNQPIRAYGCNNNRAFDRGACLDCRKNRCNTLGYNVEKVRAGQRSKRFYVKTGSRMPYKLYHYQLRIRFLQPTQSSNPSLSIALIGTKEESGDLPVAFAEEVFVNKTYTFLITLDRHLGDLMLLKLQWEESVVWTNLWNQVQTIMPWGGRVAKPHLTVGNISVKDGDTQERISFCAMTNEDQRVEISQVKVFVRCKKEPGKQHRRKHT